MGVSKFNIWTILRYNAAPERYGVPITVKFVTEENSANSPLCVSFYPGRGNTVAMGASKVGHPRASIQIKP